MIGTTLGSAEVPTFDIFDGIDLGSLEDFTDGTEDGKFDGLLPVTRLGLVDIIKLNMDEVTELCFWGRKLFDTTLGVFPTWCILCVRASIMRILD